MQDAMDKDMEYHPFLVVAVKLGIKFQLTAQTRLCLLVMLHRVLLSNYHVQSITDISKQAAHAHCWRSS